MNSGAISRRRRRRCTISQSITRWEGRLSALDWRRLPVRCCNATALIIRRRLNPASASATPQGRALSVNSCVRSRRLAALAPTPVYLFICLLIYLFVSLLDCRLICIILIRPGYANWTGAGCSNRCTDPHYITLVRITLVSYDSVQLH